MDWFSKMFQRKVLTLVVTKSQKELLEYFIANRADFDQWISKQPPSTLRFRFYYPAAINFMYGDFCLFVAYFTKSSLGQPVLLELKMTETNYDAIRVPNWKPFEEIIYDFLVSLEESKKIALFEKRRLLFEYEALCAGKAEADSKRELPYFNLDAPAPVKVARLPG